MKRTLGGWLAKGMALMAAALSASTAFAQTATGSTNCDGYVGLTNRIAGCIREAVDRSAEAYFTQFYPTLQMAITAVMTLAVIVYGILLAYGMVEKIGRDTLVLLSKITFVVFLTANSPLLYYWSTEAMDDAVAAAVSFTPSSGVATSSKADFSQAKCFQNMVEEQAKADPDKPVVGPWLGLDCLLDTIIGVKGKDQLAVAANVTAGNSATGGYNSAISNERTGLTRGLLFFFSSSMQTSILGLLFGIIGFIFILSTLFLVIKTFFTYIASYIGIAFLVIISPLMIPLILFRITKQYFDKWVKMMISFALQPVLMMVFLSLSLAAIDFAVFSGEYSIMYRIAGKASQQPGFDLNKYLTNGCEEVDKATEAAEESEGDIISVPAASTTETKCTIRKTPRTLAIIKGNNPNPAPTGKNVVGGFVNDQRESDCTNSLIALDKTGELKKRCSGNYAYKMWTENINWEALATAREKEGGVAVEGGTAAEKGQQISREILAALIFSAVLVFIMNGLLQVVPAVANDIMGDYRQSPNIAGAISKGFGSRKFGGGGL